MNIYQNHLTSKVTSKDILLWQVINEATFWAIVIINIMLIGWLIFLLLEQSYTAKIKPIMENVKDALKKRRMIK